MMDTGGKLSDEDLVAQAKADYILLTEEEMFRLIEMAELWLDTVSASKDL